MPDASSSDETRLKSPDSGVDSESQQSTVAAESKGGEDVAWYRKKEVQAAIVGGIFVVVSALVGLPQRCGPDIEVNTHGERSPAVVSGDGGEVKIDSSSNQEPEK